MGRRDEVLAEGVVWVLGEGPEHDLQTPSKEMPNRSGNKLTPKPSFSSRLSRE